MDASNTRTERLVPANRVPFAARLWRAVTFGDRLSRRTALILWLIAAIGLALYSGWSLVVAAGLSTLVLGLLPCAAMCALGLCAAGSGKKCSDNPEKSKADAQ